MKTKPGPGFALATVVVATLALHAAPGECAARSVAIDPSARAAGMGNASTAVFWSDNANEWANPALLGYGAGLAYRWGRTPLLPDLASDVEFRSHRFAYGWGGLGLAAGGLTLDYGSQPLIDASGSQLGVYVPSERIRPAGGGMSLARALRTIATWRGADAPAITRYADLALGVARKSVRVDLAPSPTARPRRTRATWESSSV